MKINSQFVFSFLDTLPIGIVFLNKDLSIFFTNKYFSTANQIPQTSINGLQFSDISNFDLKSHLLLSENFNRFTPIEINFNKNYLKDYIFTITPITIDIISTSETRDLFVLVFQDPNISELDQSAVLDPSYQEWIKTTKENIALIIYTFKTGIGPSVLLSINDEIFKSYKNIPKDNEFVITKVGLYLMTAIAQGLNQSEGLFGPLPVPEFPEINAVLYALHLNDKTQDDPRTNKKRYTIVTILYPKKYERIFLNRKRIRSTILDYFQIDDISEITIEDMSVMFNEILNFNFEQPIQQKLTTKLKATKKTPRKKRITTNLLQITELQNRIRDIHDFDKATEEIAQVVEKCVDFKLLAIFGVDKFSDELFLIKTKGYFDYKIKNVRLPIGGNSVCSKAAMTLSTVNIHDVTKVDYYITIDPTIRSDLAVPIKIKNELLGIIIVESEQINSFTQDDANIIELIAEVVATVFDHHRNEILSHDLNVLLNRLMQIEEFNEAMEEIAKFAEMLFTFSLFCILDYREEDVKFIAHRGYGSKTGKKIPKFKKTNKKYFVNHVYQTKETTYIDDLKNNPIIPYYEINDGINSEYCIPIVINDVVLGVINVESFRALDRYEIEVFETLANYTKLVWKIFERK